MNERYIYINKISAWTKFLRILWGATYYLFFRPSFAHLEVHRHLRVKLLHLFGAKCWKGIQIFPSCRIWAPWNLTTGRSVAIDDSVDLYNVDKISIGHFVAISRRAFLCTASHDILDIARPLVTKPIVIHNGVWIGAQAYIGPGVVIGEGAIVAACAVVVKDVPPWTVVGGNPARVIKKREVNYEEWRKVFLKLEKSFNYTGLTQNHRPS